jgi:hypothetical protein
MLLLPVFLHAQTGKIKGTVTDQATGDPLIGANILVIGTSFGAATDVNGNFEIRNLQAGTYSVRASYVGYQSQVVSNIRLTSGLTTEVDFNLLGEGFSVEEISIVADRPLIQKDNTNKIRTMTSDDIDVLPVRGVTNLIGLTAGVVIKDANVFIRGGRLDEVGYYLEGTNITNPITGGRAVTLSQDAVEEIQVQAGGYTAEFGGANAGIVRQQLKTGGSDYHASFEYITDNLSFKSKEDFFDGEKTLGSYQFGYTEMSGVLSGPIIDERFKFFLNVNYQFNRDRQPQPFPGVNLGIISDSTTGDAIDLTYPAGPVRGNTQDQYFYAGTFNLDFNPIILRLSGTYTHTRQDADVSQRTGRNVGWLANMFNPRLGVNEINDGSFNLKMTHIISPTMFYELTGGYTLQERDRYDPYLKDDYWAYGDSAANAAVGIVWDADRRPAEKIVYGFGFTGVNDIPVNYATFKRERLTANANFNLLVGKTHTFRFGGDLQMYTIRNFGSSGARDLDGKLDARLEDPANAGVPVEDLMRAIEISEGVNNYGYDVLGNEINSGINDAKRPVFLSAYLQDKIELDDIILNIGLRYESYDVDNKQLLDPSQPDLSVNKSTGELIESGWVDVPVRSYVSPRIGLSFPVTDLTVFHAQFGQFVQMSRLADTYQGFYRTSYELRQNFFFGSPTGRNLTPTRTTQYELGFTQQIGDNMSFDVTGYYKDIKDQVIYVSQPTLNTSDFENYYTLSNGDFATTKGLELTFTMRRTNRLAVNANLAFQDARGTGSSFNSNRGIVGAPVNNIVFTPSYVSPLEFNNAVRGNMNLDYRFAENDGPTWLAPFGVSLLMKFDSGHPFTLGEGQDDLEGEARGRSPLESLNSSTTPSTFQADLRVDKSFNIADVLDLNVYLYVINLFDSKIIENVFLRTGSADDNGVISDPDKRAQFINTYGEDYPAVYSAINLDYYQQYRNGQANLETTPLLYGPPRQVRLGIRLEY